MKKYDRLALGIAACLAASSFTRADDAKPRHVLTGHRILYCVALSADGKLIASGDLQGAIKVWDLATGKERATLSRRVPDEPGNGVPAEAVLSLALSPDGSVLASGHERGPVKLWDVATGKLTGALESHKGQILALEFSPDGKLLAVGGGESAARVWDIATRKVQATLRTRDLPFAALSFSADGKTLASAADGESDTVTLWNVTTGKAEKSIKTTTDGVNAVAFSPDGKLLATGCGHDALPGAGPTLRLWDLPAGKLRASLKGHDHPVHLVAFSSDGKLLASADHLYTAIVWDVATEKPVTTFNLSHYGGIQRAAFSRDGKHLVIAANDVLVWDIPDRK